MLWSGSDELKYLTLNFTDDSLRYITVRHTLPGILLAAPPSSLLKLLFLMIKVESVWTVQSKFPSMWVYFSLPSQLPDTVSPTIGATPSLSFLYPPRTFPFPFPAQAALCFCPLRSSPP